MTAQASRAGAIGAALLTEVAELARTDRISIVLDVWAEPEAVFVELFEGRRHAAWLDAGVGAESGWSYLCGVGEDGYVLVGHPSARTVAVEHVESSRTGEFVGSILEALDAVPLVAPRAPATGDDPFDLGWVGWIGYESGAAALGVPFAPSAHPDSALLFVDQLIAFDHARQRIVLHSFDTAGGARWAETVAGQLAALDGAQSDAPEPPGSGIGPAVLRHSPETYLDLIQRCQREIAKGESYVLCLTNEITVHGAADPTTVFRRLRRLNPTPRGGLILVAGAAVASSSPELFLRISSGGRIETRPIKGTRPRGASPEEDDAHKRELLESEKERAENVMIVDLMRNDFSRVAQLGSVQVPQLFNVEEYANVFQLVSTVTAQLAPGASAISALCAAFPAGSMTGAPKYRTMSILARLEQGPRGAYAGVFGFIGLTGRIELSMTIRAVVFDRVRKIATIGTGGGITALSSPSDEVAEMTLKAQPMLRALGACLSEGPA